MLTQLSIDNFRCLQGLDLPLNPLNLLIGPNGSGKTSVFDVIHKVRALVRKDDQVINLFQASDLTRWTKKSIQTFEIHAKVTNSTFLYRLQIEHDVSRKLARVSHEELRDTQGVLFLFKGGDVHLYRDNYSAGPIFPGDWNYSSLGGIPDRNDNTKLTSFKNFLSSLIVVRPTPAFMQAEGSSEDEFPHPRLANLTAWLRYVSQEMPDRFQELSNELKGILPGFETFRLAQTGDKVRTLMLKFSSAGSPQERWEYRFDELSEGQQMLIAVYALLFCSKQSNSVLFIDEPDNFLALQEIQPWIHAVKTISEKRNLQISLISHHPELIDVFAESVGIWFERDPQCGSRARPINGTKGGLPLSELVARGWLAGQ